MDENVLDMADCLARVKRRDEDAARALVEHLYPLVVKLVRAHLPRRSSEEDLVQEIFMKMFARLDQFAGKVPFAHWVSRIAVNTCLNRIREQVARPELRLADLSEEQESALHATLKTDEAAHPSDALGAKELADAMLASLAPPDRLLIRLLEMEERSVAEIQQITGWNSTYIRVRAFRARQKLNKQFRNLIKKGML